MLRQKIFNLLLYATELLFFGIRERCVIFQRKLASIFDHGKLLIRKEALAFHKTGADGEILLCRFIERTAEQEESLNMRKSEPSRNEIKSYIVRTA